MRVQFSKKIFSKINSKQIDTVLKYNDWCAEKETLESSVSCFITRIINLKCSKYFDKDNFSKKKSVYDKYFN